MNASPYRACFPFVGLVCVVLACGPSGQLIHPAPHAQDQLGFSVAIDGDRIIVGAAKSDTLASNGGRALAWRRQGSVWGLDQTIVPSAPSLGAQFGWAVDVSGDRAVVGAPMEPSPDGITGATYVQELVGGSWTEAERVAVTAVESFFGSTVAIEGDWAVVGAPFATPPTFTGPGVAHVYRRNPGTGDWNFHTLLGAADSIDYIEFGSSVAIDGDVIVVGAEKGVKDDAIIGGAAYVFRRQGSNWNQEAKLTAFDAAYHDRFGDAVAVSGEVILVGAKAEDARGEEAGAAYVFTRDPETGAWSQTQKLVASDGGEGDEFGYAISIDGARAVVGAWLAEGETASTAGAVYFFRRSGGAWMEDDIFRAFNGAYGDGFGASVSISGDCAVVGAPNKDVDGHTNAGAAYTFCDLPGPLPPGLDLDITCCVDVPDPAGPVVVTARIHNAGDRERIGRSWIEAVAPDGTAEVVVGPTSLVVGPNDAVTTRYPLTLTGQRPSTYELRLHWEDAGGVRTASTRVTLEDA